MSMQRNLEKVMTAAILALLASLVAMVTLAGTQGLADRPPDPASPSVDAVDGRALLDQFSAAFESAAAAVSPAVVSIYSERSAEPSANEPERPIPTVGSGVVVTEDGYILTNNHVVEHATEVNVLLSDDKEYSARVVGTDPQSDLAVIKIEAHDLEFATLGNSAEARVGQWVIAVGSPFQLQNTVTTGIISAKERSSVGLASFENFIQTDASINPGNSGGALADLDGRVIGINTAISSPSGGNVGIGFAIPINMARNIMEQLIENGRVSRGYLGLTGQKVDGSLAGALDLGDVRGTLVSDVTSDSPADRAGIRRGDVITAFNGEPIDGMFELRNLVADERPGRRAEVALSRHGERVDVTVELGERPTRTAAAAPPEPQGTPAHEELGLTVEPLTPELAERLGYEDGRGVVVSEVAPGSPADDTALQPGDLIREFGRKPVDGVEDLARAAEALSGGDSAAMLVQRGEYTFYTVIELPA